MRIALPRQYASITALIVSMTPGAILARAQGPSIPPETISQIQLTVCVSSVADSSQLVPASRAQVRSGRLALAGNSSCRQLAPDSLIKPTLPHVQLGEAITVKFSQDGAPISLAAAHVESVATEFAGKTTLVDLSEASLQSDSVMFLPPSEMMTAKRGDVLGVYVTLKNGDATTTIHRFAQRGGVTQIVVCGVASQSETRVCLDTLTDRGNDPDIPSVTPTQTVIAKFYDGPEQLELGEAGFEKVSLVVGGVELASIGSDGLDANAGDKQLILPMRKLAKTAQGSLVTVGVQTLDLAIPKYMTVRRSRDTYGSHGVWLPVGLFASNFSAHASTGVPFAVLPIGFAIGEKYYVGSAENDYVGGSFIATWQVTPQESQSNNSAANGSSQAATGYNVKQLAMGGIVDIIDWVYVGGLYNANFAKQSGEQNPGWELAVGVAPTLRKIIQLLGGTSSSK